MVPEGWVKLALSSVADVRTGIAKGKKDISDPISMPYLRVANVQDGYLDLSEIKEIEVSRNMVERYRLQDGDVLMTEGGDFDKLGRGTIWRGQVPNCLHQNHVFAVRVHEGKLLPFFFAMLSGGAYGKRYFLKAAKRSTNLASINSTQLKAFPVLLPPLPEQKKIAEILSTWDRAIEVAERQLETARLQKKALMQQLLTGSRRLPGFDGDWKIVKLGDVCELVNGRGFKPHEWGDEGYPIIRIQNLNGSDEFNYYNGAFNPKLLVLPGDLLFAWSGSRGTSFGPHVWNGPEAVLNYHTWNVKTREDLDKTFFYWLLQQITAEIENSAHGAAALVHTQKREMEKRLLAIPRLEEQKKISDLMSNFLQVESNYRQNLTHLRTEKRALMQQLLTGKKRVTV